MPGICAMPRASDFALQCDLRQGDRCCAPAHRDTPRRTCRLPHRPTEPLFPSPRLADELARAGEHGAQRCSQALGEIQPHRIAAFGEIGRRHDPTLPPHSSAERHPCAWKAHVCARPRDRRVRRRSSRAAAAIHGLLHLHQTLRRRITRHRTDRLFQRIDGELATFALQSLDQRACDRCRRATFA